MWNVVSWALTGFVWIVGLNVLTGLVIVALDRYKYSRLYVDPANAYNRRQDEPSEAEPSQSAALWLAITKLREVEIVL